MRKKEALAVAFALYAPTFVTDVKAQSAARQNAPPGMQKQLAKQFFGDVLRIRDSQRIVC